MRGYAAALTILLAMLGGCAGPKSDPFPTISETLTEDEADRQREEIILEQAAQQYRVLDVAFPIFVENAEFCGGRVGPDFGVRILNANTFDPYESEWQEAAVRLYRADARLMIVHMVPDGPAARAGFEIGDRLLSLNGRPFPKGAGAITGTERMFRSLPEGPVTVVVERDGAEIELAVEPVQACKYPLVVLQDRTPNAYADDDKIMVTSGMLDFVKNDVELAVVISHELAHNVMDHVDAREANAAAGAAGGLLIDMLFALGGINTSGAFTRAAMNAGAASYSEEFEREADYVGMYMLARAGYDYNLAADLWQRMPHNKTSQTAASVGATHPTSTARFIAMESAAQEIFEKQEANVALVPEIEDLPDPGGAVGAYDSGEVVAFQSRGGRDVQDDGDATPLGTGTDVPIGDESKIGAQGHGSSWGPIRVPTDP